MLFYRKILVRFQPKVILFCCVLTFMGCLAPSTLNKALITVPFSTVIPTQSTTIPASPVKVASTITLTADQVTPAFGSEVRLTVAVTGYHPTGTVSFAGNIYSNNDLGSCTLVAGTCSVVVNQFLPGTQIVAAGYAGDGNNLSSGTSEHYLTVGSRTYGSSSTALSVSALATRVGSTVVLTASVPVNGATGNVTFLNGSTVLGTAKLQAVSGSGIAGSLFGLSLGGVATAVGANNADASAPAPNLIYGVSRSWGQRFLTWSEINTASGVFDWTYLDAWVAQNAGHDLVFTLGDTPEWASLYPTRAGHDKIGACAPPANLAYWNDWVTAVATRYASSIKYWEIWNEPQDPGYFCGANAGSTGSFSTMVSMASTAYSTIKRIIPSAQIISPAPTQWGYTASPGSEWMKSFLAAGGSATFDILGFHGYLWVSDGRPELLNQIVSQINAVMAAASISKPIWDTEASWCCNVVLASNRQAGFTSKMYLLHQSLGVQRLIWFQYAGIPLTGQMYNNSTGENANALAFRETYRWLVGATQSSPCSATATGTLITCGYTRPGGYFAQAVWQTNGTGTTYSYTYPAGMTEYRDLSGGVHALNGGTVLIGDAPILLENGSVPAFTATLSTTALPVGTNALTAMYEGNAYNAGSTSISLPVTVSQ